MPRILSISSGRADVSILAPVWHALAGRPELDLAIFATGMHCGENASKLPVPDGIKAYSGGADLEGRVGLSVAQAMMSCAAAAADLLERERFDCILLLGDRLDMIPTAFAALPFNIPLAHLHGGELTYGVIDERIRHAVTKLAHLHFTSSVEAANRIVQMGEQPDRVHVTGAPGLDTFVRAPRISAADFARLLNLPFGNEFVLVTVHPETNAANPAMPMQAVLEALNRCTWPILITAPNSDPGGQRLRAMIEEFLARKPEAVFRESLGPDLYPSALHHAAAMVGNSSSGPIEAGLAGLPAINVGARQQGRAYGENVRNVPNDAAAVLAALQTVMAGKVRYPAFSPYGDGHAGQRIADVLATLPDRWRLLEKTFHDGRSAHRFVAPWDDQESERKIRSGAL